jgi:IS30 family transposase
MQISHEAIYRSLFIQTRGVLKKELTAQLRTARRMRRPKSHNAKRDGVIGRQLVDS